MWADEETQGEGDDQGEVVDDELVLVVDERGTQFECLVSHGEVVEVVSSTSAAAAPGSGAAAAAAAAAVKKASGKGRKAGRAGGGEEKRPGGRCSGTKAYCRRSGAKAS